MSSFKNHADVDVDVGDDVEADLDGAAVASENYGPHHLGESHDREAGYGGGADDHILSCRKHPGGPAAVARCHGLREKLEAGTAVVAMKKSRVSCHSLSAAFWAKRLTRTSKLCVGLPHCCHYYYPQWKASLRDAAAAYLGEATLLAQLFQIMVSLLNADYHCCHRACSWRPTHCCLGHLIEGEPRGARGVASKVSERLKETIEGVKGSGP